jgi:hypothetical protein
MVKDGLKNTSSAVAGSLVVALITSAISKWRGYDEDIPGEIVASLVGNVAFAGNIYNSLYKGFTSGNLIDQGVNDLAISVRNIFDGNGKPENQIRKITESIAQLSGVPVKNVTREFESALRQIDPLLAYQWDGIWKTRPSYVFAPEVQKFKESFSKTKKKYDTAKEKRALTRDLAKEYAQQKAINDAINKVKRSIEAVYNSNLTPVEKKARVKTLEDKITELLKKIGD